MRRTLAVLLPLLLLGPAPSTAVPLRTDTCQGTHWVGSWAAAPSNAGHVEDASVARPLAAQTVRMVVRPTLSGERARVRLTHRYGVAPVLVAHATVARRDSGASALDGTMRELTFGGAPHVVLRPGKDVTSDPVSLPVRAGRDLLVSLHVPDTVDRPTEHFITNTTSYLAPTGTGDHAGDEAATAFTLTTRHAFSVGWYLLAGVDVRAPRDTGAVVAFGDSITDGFQVVGPTFVENPGVMDRHARYPDFLAARLSARADGPRMSVLNSGVSGNRVLDGAEPPWPYGDSGLERFEADVLRLPGVTDVIVMEGINDLGGSEEVSAQELANGLLRLVRLGQRAGLRMHLGTLLPAGGAARGHGSEATARRRDAVNRWIRTGGVADSVVDFDEALRDPQAPGRLRPDYDSGDHLHPSSAGYRAMARAVRLAALRGTGC